MHRSGWDGDSAREQQRKRQNEYHAALAEQVRVQEAKKRAERYGDVSGSASTTNTQGGLFAGLGQNHVIGKSSYSRGHHVERMTAEMKRQSQVAPLETASDLSNQQHMNPDQFNQHPHQFPALDSQYPPLQSPYGQPYQPHYHERMNTPPTSQYGAYVPPPLLDPSPGFNQNGVPSLPVPPQQVHHYGGNDQSPPPPAAQVPPPPTSHGRRHMMGDSTSDRRKNAQVEAQSFLKQQMEENQRRKQEEKRKKDEEERLELQRIEKELKLQAEAYENEKKQKKKESLAKQQQLDDDLRLKQEEAKKISKHKQDNMNVAATKQDAYHPPMQPVQNTLSSPRDALPTWNHQQNDMFGGPPQAPYYQEPQYGNNFYPPVQPPPMQFEPPVQQYPSPMSMYPQMHHVPSHAHLQPMMSYPGIQVPPSMHFFVDERLQMLAAELARQKALVEQLVTQNPSSHAPGSNSITLDDFERLKREMQDEIDRRDALHRKELEAWKKQTGQQSSIPLSVSRNFDRAQPNVNSSIRYSFDPRQSVPTSLPAFVDELHDNTNPRPSSPQIAFPGQNGQYKINTAKANPVPQPPSPQGAFPGQNGQYKINAAKANPAPQPPSPQGAFPGQNGQYKINTAKANPAPQPPSPQGTFPGQNGQYNIDDTKNAPLQQPPSPQGTFPGQNGRYKVDSSPKSGRSQARTKEDQYNDKYIIQTSSTSLSKSQQRTRIPPKFVQNYENNQDERELENKSSSIASSFQFNSPKKDTQCIQGQYDWQSSIAAATSAPNSRKNQSASPDRQKSPHKVSGVEKILRTSTKLEPVEALTNQTRTALRQGRFNVEDLTLQSRTRGTPTVDSQTLRCESKMIYINGSVDVGNQAKVQDEATSQLVSSHVEVVAPKTRIGYITSKSSQEKVFKAIDYSVVEKQSNDLTQNDPQKLFHVNSIEPSINQSFRYSYVPHAAYSSEAENNFDIDELFERNTTRNELLQQFDGKQTEPQDVENLVTTFRALSTRRVSSVNVSFSQNKYASHILEERRK